MSTLYELGEDAIKDRLLAQDDQGNESPFKSASVLTYGSQMTDADLIGEIEKVKQNAPACLVFYSDSDFAGTYSLEEEARFHVIIVASGTSKLNVLRSAKGGVYLLADWVRSRLHNWRDDEQGRVSNPLRIVNQMRIVEPGRAATAASLRMVFVTQITRSS